MNTLQGAVILTEVTCGECIIHFAMDKELYQRCLDTGRDFYCPNGHCRVFRETTVHRLQRERDEAKQIAESVRKRLLWTESERDAEKLSHRATKGQLTKTRNRIANGVCPCCHRTFKQLAAHMSNKHPDFKKAVTE